MKGLFGGMFDFNGDGELDVFERASECYFFNEVIMAEQGSELEAAGLDIDGLEFMDEYERRRAMEEAGLDPDEYDLW